MLKTYFSDRTKRLQQITLAVAILTVAILGTILLLGSHAATPYASITADSGTLASGAVAQSCTGAANGKCVVFKGTGGGTQTTDCFASPGACGYPDPNYNNNSGATSVGSTTPCGSLPASGSVTASTNGQTIQNLNIAGGVAVDASNVTINNVCVTDPDGGSGALAITIEAGSSNLLIEHTTVAGTSSTNALDTGIWNASNISSVTANNVYIYNAAEDWHGSGTVTNSYMQAGATYSGSHNEDVYLSDTGITLTHDTLLNSTGQTAVLFGDNDGGAKDQPADNHWTVKNSLMAGGGYLMYLDAANNSSMPVGSSTMDIENNRFGRCLGPQHFDGSGTTCTTGTDKYGYFPNGGYYGGPVDDYCSGSGQTWSNNVWDDNSSALSC